MKKIYLMAIAFAAVSITANAQVELNDNFDTYSQGDISPQADHWRTWSGDNGSSVESADVAADQQFSGAFSMRVNGDGAPAGIDQLLLIDSQPDTGDYTIQWKMFVPSGKEGYFNAQSEIAANQSNAPGGNSLFGGNVYFNEANGNPGVGTVDGTPGQVFQFDHDVWFTVACVYDIDAQTWDMQIDGVSVFVAPQEFTFNQAFLYIGAIDFYAPSADTLYYVDDVVLAVGVLGVNDFAANAFSVYPNPVKDQLNISGKVSVDSVVIYDVLGKVVLTATPSTINPVINTSGLTSGVYLVKITANGGTQTIKVLK